MLSFFFFLTKSDEEVLRHPQALFLGEGKILLQQLLSVSLHPAIQNVAAQTGFSAERVINAINMGDCGIITAVKDCCCNTQQSILKMGYEQQLATCQ